MKEYRALIGPLVVVLLGVIAVFWSPFEPHPPPVVEGAFDRPVAEPTWSDEDWAIFERTVRWALDEELDQAPFGVAIAEIGRSFVGTAYVPKTLEAPGDERLVINFRGLDCVTFVENVLALARFVFASDDPTFEPRALLEDRGAAEARYASLLMAHRYRGGALDGYTSRLHYFSEWIVDNADRGLVRNVTRELGGVRDTTRIDFMSTHPDAYRQLADESVLAQIAAMEESLSDRPRWIIPQRDVAGVADRIQEGDVIAAASTVPGLDIAHTGLAVRIDGALHLLHAPLVGEAVQISEVPLADRLLRIGSQDGIMVARPIESSPGTS